MKDNPKKKNIISIDGRQLARRYGGVQRYLREVLSELDKIAPKGLHEIVIPNDINLDISYENIEVVRFGSFKGLLWEQLELPGYLRKYNSVGAFFCSVYPFFIVTELL